MLRGLERRVIRVLRARLGADRRRTGGIGALLVFALIFSAFTAGATPADDELAPSGHSADAIVRLDAARLVDATDSDSDAITLGGDDGRHRPADLREFLRSILREHPQMDRPDFVDLVLADTPRPRHRRLRRLAGDVWARAREGEVDGGSMAVPEPSTAGLMGLGLALLAVHRRGFRFER